MIPVLIGTLQSLGTSLRLVSIQALPVPREDVIAELARLLALRERAAALVNGGQHDDILSSAPDAPTAALRILERENQR